MPIVDDAELPIERRPAKASREEWLAKVAEWHAKYGEKSKLCTCNGSKAGHDDNCPLSANG